MLKIKYTSQFKKDYKSIRKRGYDLQILIDVINRLANQQILDKKFHDHALHGNYDGFRECHLEPDWLLIYRIDGNNFILVVTRTGSHSDFIQIIYPI